MKRIFDPIHRFIELEDGELRLIAHPAMQRMRRLRQLGLAYLAYPSAEHSRFSHALGAVALGERVLAALRTHSPEYFESESDYTHQRRLLRASLLLHDVGHGPFSHACEAVLGRRHETRTAAILGLHEIDRALGDLGLDAFEVLSLIAGGPSRYPVLRELVSGPNLDCDRMDYLLRDSYFTGVRSGSYDVDQLVGSLRVFEAGGGLQLGVDGRGVVALESFVLARYMMFATVYFHHTTRMFEHILHEALGELWPNPRALDPIEEYLAWDDVRVLEAFRTMSSTSAAALRQRFTLYGLAAEFNAEHDLSIFNACERALRELWGDAVWSDTQEELLHRLPLGVASASDEGAPTVWVRTTRGTVDAREASDLIAKISGKAYWRKLFVLKAAVDIDEARRICREIDAQMRSPGEPLPF
ncbi:MAG: HD domain-containing protein [Candidatus Eremiobacteraeota bacterium]|nr:HD domain-containing protein [Candidatus Eremiobacteraeota bacterium]MBV8355297.1 HD domain-containing protein [Candidatus Eremiobacteraeota bacterium]